MSNDVCELMKALENLDNDERCYKNVWEYFKYIRGEIKHEYDLLKGRVTWYITCQSFLITAYVLSCNESKSPNWFSNYLLPLLAFCITILAISMIQDTITTIKMWIELRDSLIANKSFLKHLIIKRWHSKSDPLAQSALMFPHLIPIIFGIFWLVIFVCSWSTPWINS